MKALYELHGQGQSIRAIARELGISRNTVRRYVRSPEVPKPAPRPPRGSKLAPYQEYILKRLSEGVDNCVVLLREIKEQGYPGGYTILKDFVHPLRRRSLPRATVRLETKPGEQAQVDFGSCEYRTPDGRTRRVWAFVMVLSWSRALYVEFVERADVATFIRCHIHAFSYLGGVVRKCLYDNAKVVVLGRDEAGRPVWNERFLDFALRVGFEIKLCHPYRPQTKGRVESGIKYVKRNFWPTARFVDRADLNRQAGVWRDTVANTRIHGTTGERPAERLEMERAYLSALPGMERLTPFLRDERRVGRDGYVQWEGACYGLPWPWKPGEKVEVEARGGIVELWSGNRPVAVHAQAVRPGKRLTHPRQWAGLSSGGGQPAKKPLAVQLPTVEVERRPLTVYEMAARAVSAGD